MKNIEILYEDNHLIAVNKKPSEIVQGDKTGDEPLSEKIKQYLRVTYNKPGNVFLGVIHRIDRPVSGVVVFAKTGKALSRMNELFRTKKVQKTYWAVTENIPEQPEGTLVHYLKKNQKQNKSYALLYEEKDYKRAELTYKTLAHSDRYHLLEIHPLTGRHHQIRVQLSAVECPIKGDVKYGFKRPNKDVSIHLHARKVEFIHPVKKEPVSIVSSPPDDVLWNAFTKFLK